MGIYKRSKNDYTIVVYRNGIRRDMRFQGTKREAQNAEAEFRVKLGQEVKETKSPIKTTFDVVVNETYQPYAALHVKDSTSKSRASILNRLSEAFKDTPITELTSQDLQEYAQERLEDGAATSTINNELRVAGIVLGLARKQGLPIKATVEVIPERRSDQVKYWTPEEMKRLLAACKEVSSQLYYLISFLAHTGCRKGEALALRLENVDLKRRLVFIAPSSEWQPKNGRGRAVPLPDSLVEYLNGTLYGVSEYVFHDEKGGRLKSFPRHAYNKALAIAGLEGTVHRVRHSFASAFIAKTGDLFLLSKVLGHSSVAVTGKYAHLMPEHLAQAMDVVSF